MSVRKEDALEYHRRGKKGKIEITPTKPVSTVRDLALAYSPGVAYPCLEIAQDVDQVYEYTARGNVVAVISNGTAVLGLGNIGPEASKPVMEGKAVLFKKYADIDGIDIEIAVTDPDEFCRVVKALEPSFGGINLEDVKAPECFEIETRLRRELNIPIMHDDQHGTAIISAAALLNALRLVGKKIDEIKMTVSGAGAAALSCVSMYVRLGLKKENLVMFDVHGVIDKNRTDLDPLRMEFATERTGLKFADSFEGADVFIGLSAGGIVSGEMLKRMAPRPIVFALANPIPEIDYPTAVEARPDCVMATGRSDYPNQVNNVLGFPYVFRGALDVRATEINDEMKMAAVEAIAELARQPVPEEIAKIYDAKLSFGKEYLIPKPMDHRLITEVSAAVARAAMASGVARHRIDNWEVYKESLRTRMGLNAGIMPGIIQRAKNHPKRIVLPESYNYKILKAAQILADEKIAVPVLLGNQARIEALLDEYEIELKGAEYFDLDAERERRLRYADTFFARRARKGMTLQEAKQMMRRRDYFGMSMVEAGDADGIVLGVTQSYASAVRAALEVSGLEPQAKTCAGLYIMNTRKGVYLFADCTVNREPTDEQLVDIARLSARAAKFLDVVPRVAFISYANFGGAKDELNDRIRRAVRLAQQHHPDILIEGEMQANIAVRPDLQKEFFPFSRLSERGANVLVFPTLVAANACYKVLQELGEVEAVGPVLLGINKPVHIVQLGSSVREIVNMVAITVVDAQAENVFF
jgi:malate dehydrogenase (oxaloacetate-decarboxylating)(NADP+)